MIDRSQREMRPFNVVYGPIDDVITVQARSSLEAGSKAIEAWIEDVTNIVDVRNKNGKA